ncbi:c-type cytochrome [Falsiroseomonas sp.]|uniref:c-type cytochrome n=1 Tax=Falsiroseomonas sp. TaxID=2870721 RepID=UPI003F70F838
MSSSPPAEGQSRRIGLIAGLVVAALAISILAFNNLRGGQAEAARGRWTADNRCGGCHDVAETAQPTRRSGTPSFVLLAQGGPSREAIEAFLQRPHAAMPPFTLSAEERHNLAAYMASLAPSR